MMKRPSKPKLGTRLLVLLCLMGFGLMIGSVLGVLALHWGMLPMLVVQDVLVFIVPAVVMMAIFYTSPLKVIGLNRAPDMTSLVLIVLLEVVSLPAMNWLVAVNEAMTLPSWLSGLEQVMRMLEDSAAKSTEAILNIHTVGQLIAAIFVIGVMAGLSEEILFRGAMLRTMQDSRLNTHVVVWTVAFIFSAFHLQFYGFVPRLLLGVWLGYLLVWTGSLWVPIIAHTLNNSTVVVFSYLANKGIVTEDFGDNLGLPAEGSFPWLAMFSLIACVCIAVWANRHYRCRRPEFD